jgi:hypothetical protein
MIKVPDSQRRYNSAKDRFLQAGMMNFFAREFPKLFGPVMRQKLAVEIVGLFQSLSPEITRLKPGQILWNALDHKTRGDSPNRRYVPVILSLITPEDVDLLAQGQPMTQIAEKAIARMIREAYAQGGILSMRDIGLLLLKDPSTVSQLRKKYESRQDCILPHTGALQDAGSCLSHKVTIVRKVIMEKKDPADVARECRHTQKAVDRYLKDYQRVKTVSKHSQDLDYIHTVTGLAKHVVKQYIILLHHEKHLS